MRAILCASLCNCRHSLRAANDEELARAALVHVRLHHPAARVGEERIREIVFARAYDVEYAPVSSGGIEPDEEFGPEPY